MAILLSLLDTVLSKFVFISKFACDDLAFKTSVAKVLNSGVVIYLSWLWLLSSNSVILVSQSVFLTRLLILGILFSTVVNSVFVAKLLAGILPSISAILASQLVFLTRLQVSGILFSNSDLSVSCLVFKTNPLASILFTLPTNLAYSVF